MKTRTLGPLTHNNATVRTHKKISLQLTEIRNKILTTRASFLLYFLFSSWLAFSWWWRRRAWFSSDVFVHRLHETCIWSKKHFANDTELLVVNRDCWNAW